MFQGLYLVYLIDTNILLFSFDQTEKLTILKYPIKSIWK